MMRKTRTTRTVLGLIAVAAILLLAAEQSLAGGFSISFGSSRPSYHGRSSYGHSSHGSRYGHSSHGSRYGHSTYGSRYGHSSHGSRYGHSYHGGHSIFSRPIYRPTYRAPVVRFGWSW